MKIADVDFVKEFYPRVREDAEAIDRYRASLELLPPIVVARGRILVDGFHRLQAHKLEGAEEINAEDLGNLSDLEILRESIKRNASHGRQLETRDKKRMADILYRQGIRDIADIATAISVTASTAEKYVSDARRDEKRELQERVTDLWLDCHSENEITELVRGAVTQKTVNNWVSNFRTDSGFTNPPESRQHFDVWQFQSANDDAGTSTFFGRMPPQVVENLLWLYTEPGDIVRDPFAGGGTTIDVAKRMGRRVYATDLNPSTPTLPIRQADATQPWPSIASGKASLVILDPPYWQQAKGRYSDDDGDLGNMNLDAFNDAWHQVAKHARASLTDGGRIAFIISPTQREDGSVVDHALEMADIARGEGFAVERRIIVTYQTQQATGQQVEWARDNKRLLKLYRDLVVMR